VEALREENYLSKMFGFVVCAERELTLIITRNVEFIGACFWSLERRKKLKCQKLNRWS
jgi:hypothetical protein